MNLDDKFKFIHTELSIMLKNHGFHKHGFLWYRQHKEFKHVIQIQKSQWNTDTEISFTFNFGIFLPALAEFSAQRFNVFFTKSLSMSNCFPNLRIGYISEKDIWWTCKQDSDLANIINEVSTSLINICFYLFNSVSSNETLLLFLTNIPSNKFLLGIREQILYVSLLILCNEQTHAKSELGKLIKHINAFHEQRNYSGNDSLLTQLQKAYNEL